MTNGSLMYRWKVLHNAPFLTCIKRYSVLKTIFGLLFEWPLKTGLTVHEILVLIISVICQGSRETEQVCSLIKAFVACIHTVKPVLVATYIKQAYIQFRQNANTLKSTCIKQAPVLSKHILTIT